MRSYFPLHPHLPTVTKSDAGAKGEVETFLQCIFDGHWPRAGSWYLRGILRRSFCGGAYSIPRAPAGRGPWHAWGVVQLVGHLTVNEDGEGSNPSAPAKSLRPRAQGASLWRSATLHPASPSSRRPSIPRCCSPFSADCPPPARNEIRRHNREQALCSCPERAARCRAR